MFPSIAMLLMAPKFVNLPLVARGPGLVVGGTSIRECEGKFGDGYAHVGGHPHGARTWYDKTSKATIDADGFTYSHSGEVIEGYTLRWLGKNAQRSIPAIRIPRSRLGLAGTLKRGMSRSEVEKAIGSALKDDSAEFSGLIQYSENLVNKDSSRYSTWTFTAEFGGRGLEGFAVSAN